MRDDSFVPTDYDIFAGLDVDKKSIAVTFTTHQGFVRSLKMPYNAEQLMKYVRKHFSDQRLAFAYEAGPTGYGLYDGLVAESYRCLIAAPSMIPKAPGQRLRPTGSTAGRCRRICAEGNLKAFTFLLRSIASFATSRSFVTRW